MNNSILGPDAADWNGTLYKSILATEDSQGAMSITDSVSPPNSGPPRHIHHDADEVFVILSGECEFWLAGETFYRGPGETAFIPRGVEHTFRVVGDAPCRHLLILTPGGFEGFFYEMASEKRRIPEDMDAIVEAGERFHLSFTGPPLGTEGAA
ncbi:cupin domain-containing protein [Litorisediminicola beolgyonensis]|uniref:Cupin domain-containing protein n=1 Tax=Litorisediminicola beolgyonensis TaxID=1173614 RepID=A0ABW3ZHN5_9RHOB